MSPPNQGLKGFESVKCVEFFWDPELSGSGGEALILPKEHAEAPGTGRLLGALDEEGSVYRAHLARGMMDDVDGLHAFRDGVTALAVTCGSPYLVRFQGGLDGEEVLFGPTTGLHVIPELDAVALCTFSRAALVNVHGIAWKTGDLCTDDMRIISAQDGHLTAAGWEAAGDYTHYFRIDLATGQVLESWSDKQKAHWLKNLLPGLFKG